MNQPQVSNTEGGDSVPTLRLLTCPAKALDASLSIDLDGGRQAFVFAAHHGQRPDGAAPGGRTSAT
ncbi:hypothetical protein [Streptomyces sp. NPDC088725]|uniref:hypothetical protein n=1 Tax=Streptomyces sp. NPDC088725 TaxID=3365873 RepID=UPI00380D5321